MARNRISVHPFGYKKLRGSDKERRLGHQIDKDNVQLVTMKVPYEVPVRKNGKLIFIYDTILLMLNPERVKPLLIWSMKLIKLNK